MDDVQQSVFPLTLEFKLTPGILTFASSDELEEWINDERTYWSDFLSQPGKQAAHIRENYNIIGGIKASSIIANSDICEILQDEYVPKKIFGTIFSRLSTPDTALINLILQEIKNPGSVQIANGGQVEAKIIAALVRTTGNPTEILQHITSISSKIDKVDAEHRKILQKYETLYEKANEDWSKQVEAFRAKAALAAPKEYWSSRAKKHERATVSVRRQWYGSLIALVVSTAILPGALFLPAVSRVISPYESPIAGLIERAVIFATILAIIVWWSKQLLRDLRSHEHLAEDATERVTMIETYAALVEKGLDGADLAPVLTALYRPASTGLVEDSGPVLPFEVLVKSAVDVAKKGKD